MRPEPDHGARRTAILAARPDVKRLFGPTAVTACLGLAVVMLQFGLAALLAHAPWWAVFACAVFVGAFAIHCLNCIIHECTHNLAFGNGAANRALAVFVNIPSLVPSAMAFRHYHLLHHHHFGMRGMDSDVPTGWEVRLVENSTMRKLIWLILLPVSYGLLHPLHVRARMPFDRWLALNITTVAAAWIGALWFLGWPSVIYLLLSTYFATGPHPAGAHILQEHVAFDGGSGMASYYGPVNLVSVNLGYHLEHHDMPAISGWRLPALRRMAPEFYSSHYHHRSRFLGLLQFVFDGRIALDSRTIRELPPLRAMAKSAAS
ncbi:MAG TPA: fatty acid desaturase [Rhizomicrobium sp.]|jgi:sphingolipid delta-4 desaturase|nr:fatty acid desaturase [Rhizomicrobium sp.]